MHSLQDLLYPQLRSFAAGERRCALREARDTPFDVIELVGMAFGLVTTVSLTCYGLEQWGPLERLAVAVANFAVAVPLLTLLIGPFLVRRTRRGLDQELARRTRR